MKRIPVHSSILVSVGYDKKNRILEIEFTAGTLYQYYNVSESIFTGLLSAHSHGKYLNDQIIDHYHYQKIS